MRVFHPYLDFLSAYKMQLAHFLLLIMAIVILSNYDAFEKIG